jgi:hypothetical protein
VKVFFDECVPRPLRRLLSEHEIQTAQEMGWGRLKNGELLRKAEENAFQVFVTSDQNLRYQQNLEDRQIALLILSTNFWPAIRARVDVIKTALEGLKPSQYLELEIGP